MLSVLLERPARFTATVAESAFRTCTVIAEGMGLEVRLTRAA